MILKTGEKQIRAEIIKAYIEAAGYAGVVCFSCGNATRALIEAGVNTVDISPTGVLITNKWWTPADIRRVWPHLFDATSGHLPAHLMVEIADRLRQKLSITVVAGETYEIPTGSGETIACMRWAFPQAKFVPVSDGSPATTRSRFSALDSII